MIENYTPHKVNVNGRVFESLGIARCEQWSTLVYRQDGIDIMRGEYGEVYDLPEPRYDENGDLVLLIVSMIVRSALPNRYDLVSPGELIRDSEGRVVGCKNLFANIP